MFWNLTKSCLGLIAVCGLAVAHIPAQASEQVSVSGHAGPWQWSSTLNSSFEFNAASNDQQPPTVVAANVSAGIHFTPGNALKLAYVSGGWSGGGSFGAVDANGYPSSVIPSASVDGGSTPDGWDWEPGSWCPANEFPHNWASLLGVFTDGSGTLVGTPYAIGNSRQLDHSYRGSPVGVGNGGRLLPRQLGSVTMSVTEVLSGDANGDGTVNGADLNIVLSNYNQTGMTWSQGDFNGDGTVNGADLNVVLSNYNQVAGVSAAVPEPSAFVLLGIGAISILGYARRQRVA